MVLLGELATSLVAVEVHTLFYGLGSLLSMLCTSRSHERWPVEGFINVT
jgi:hypothetical protein